MLRTPQLCFDWLKSTFGSLRSPESKFTIFEKSDQMHSTSVGVLRPRKFKNCRGLYARHQPEVHDSLQSCRTLGAGADAAIMPAPGNLTLFKEYVQATLSRPFALFTTSSESSHLWVAVAVGGVPRLRTGGVRRKFQAEVGKGVRWGVVESGGVSDMSGLRPPGDPPSPHRRRRKYVWRSL